jgi:hypothetical protein
VPTGDIVAQSGPDLPAAQKHLPTKHAPNPEQNPRCAQDARGAYAAGGVVCEALTCLMQRVKLEELDAGAATQA